jgi:thiamine-phosphate pyrophosphorylase
MNSKIRKIRRFRCSHNKPSDLPDLAVHLSPVAPRLIFVTDSSYGDERIVRCVKEAGAAMPPGWLAVQLRDKARARASLRVFAGELRMVTRAVGALLVINGDAEIARDVGADGVHLGGGAGPVHRARATVQRPAWVSVAAHTGEEVRRALGEGADAVLVSPVYDSTGGKKGKGPGLLREARAIAGAKMSVVALGGVDAAKAPECIAAGADAVAVVRALLGAAEPFRIARALHDVLARHC